MENPMYQPSIRYLDDNEEPRKSYILADVPVQWEIPGLSPISPHAARIKIPVRLETEDGDLPFKDLSMKIVKQVPDILRALADAAEKQIRQTTDDESPTNGA